MTQIPYEQASANFILGIISFVVFVAGCYLFYQCNKGTGLFKMIPSLQRKSKPLQQPVLKSGDKMHVKRFTEHEVFLSDDARSDSDGYPLDEENHKFLMLHGCGEVIIDYDDDGKLRFKVPELAY